MSPLRVGLAIPLDRRLDVDSVVTLASRAEELGYHSFWVPEAWGRDAFVQLAAVAAATRRLVLGTGIVNVYSRSPALLAMAAATLNELSRGRFILGLGTSGPAVIEGWHGVPFRRPVRRLEEAVAILRMALAGRRVEYEGEVFQVGRGGQGLRLDVPSPAAGSRREVPIFLAVLGEAGTRLAARVADGWIPLMLPVDRYGEALGQIGAPVGVPERGSEGSAFEVAPYLFACASDDGEQARAAGRRHVAFYIGAMGTYYYEAARRWGFAQEAERVRQAWQAGERAAAEAAVSDALLDAVALCGTPAFCREQLERFAAAGATLPIAALGRGMPEELIESTLRALAPGPA